MPKGIVNYVDALKKASEKKQKETEKASHMIREIKKVAFNTPIKQAYLDEIARQRQARKTYLGNLGQIDLTKFAQNPKFALDQLDAQNRVKDLLRKQYDVKRTNDLPVVKKADTELVKEEIQNLRKENDARETKREREQILNDFEKLFNELSPAGQANYVALHPLTFDRNDLGQVKTAMNTLKAFVVANPDDLVANVRAEQLQILYDEIEDYVNDPVNGLSPEERLNITANVDPENLNKMQALYTAVKSLVASKKGAMGPPAVAPGMLATYANGKISVLDAINQISPNGGDIDNYIVDPTLFSQFCRSKVWTVDAGLSRTNPPDLVLKNRSGKTVSQMQSIDAYAKEIIAKYPSNQWGNYLNGIPPNVQGDSNNKIAEEQNKVAQAQAQALAQQQAQLAQAQAQAQAQALAQQQAQLAQAQAQAQAQANALKTKVIDDSMTASPRGSLAKLKAKYDAQNPGNNDFSLQLYDFMTKIGVTYKKNGIAYIFEQNGKHINTKNVCEAFEKAYKL